MNSAKVTLCSTCTHASICDVPNCLRGFDLWELDMTVEEIEHQRKLDDAREEAEIAEHFAKHDRDSVMMEHKMSRLQYRKDRIILAKIAVRKKINPNYDPFAE